MIESATGPKHCQTSVDSEAEQRMTDHAGRAKPAGGRFEDQLVPGPLLAGCIWIREATLLHGENLGCHETFSVTMRTMVATANSYSSFPSNDLVTLHMNSFAATGTASPGETLDLQFQSPGAFAWW